MLVTLSVTLLTALAGCAEDEQATPRVTFDSTVDRGSHSPAECPQSGTWFTIGSFGNPARGREDPNNPESPLKDPVRPVEDGGEDQQGTASVTCSVIEAGDGFEIALHAELSGATGGAVTITGRVLPGQDSPGVRAAVTRKGETYSSNECLITFNPALGQGVAPGRVWGNLRCDTAEAPSQQRVCSSSAQFRFENCAQ